jgi:NAD(P)-dependent dehydrogenase (short-subunit alcohol dehydrogenase family)
LTKTAAFEYAKKHIRINAVAPGTVRTALLDRFTERWPEYQADSNLVIPMERVANPSEIAHAVVWLCSPDSSYVTGHVMAIDGGRTCV